jgi:hypothetical protein
MERPEISESLIEDFIEPNKPKTSREKSSLPMLLWTRSQKSYKTTYINWITIPNNIEFAENIKEANPAIAKKFNELTIKWKKETAGLSSIPSIVMNRNYQKIIALGPTVVPLILSELEKEKRDWLWALEMLVDDEDNPITPEVENSFIKSVQTWIAWGKKRDLI